jgi:hypothetical protein
MTMIGIEKRGGEINDARPLGTMVVREIGGVLKDVMDGVEPKRLCYACYPWMSGVIPL